MAEVLGHVVTVRGELLGDDRDHRAVVLLDRHRIGDRERRARAAGAETDDGEVDRGRELGDVAAVGRAGVAHLARGLDRGDAGDAVGRRRCSQSAASSRHERQAASVRMPVPCPFAPPPATLLTIHRCS